MLTERNKLNVDKVHEHFEHIFNLKAATPEVARAANYLATC